MASMIDHLASNLIAPRNLVKMKNWADIDSENRDSSHSAQGFHRADGRLRFLLILRGNAYCPQYSGFVHLLGRILPVRQVC